MGVLRRLFGRSEPSPHGDPQLTNALRLTSKGNHYGERRKLERAISCFKDAINAKPDHIPAFMGLAMAYSTREEWKRALDTLDRAPTDPGVPSTVDYAAELAFHKAQVLITKHKWSGWAGDTSDLREALEHARKVTMRRRKISEETRLLASTLGVNLKAQKKERVALLDQLITELQARTRRD